MRIQNSNVDRISKTSESMLIFLRSYIDFDSLIILGYQKDCQPVYLFSSATNLKNLPFQKLYTSSYAFDPFYSQFSHQCREGIYGVGDVISDSKELDSYREKFQSSKSCTDELAINIKIDEKRWVVFFLRRSNHKAYFRPEEKCRLRESFGLLKDYCERLWPRTWTLGTGADNQVVSLAEIIPLALTSFGSDNLTDREQEVARLMIKGLDNKAIAVELDIKLATVKAHRKNIYFKLDITSLGELFQVFLNHLVVFSYQAMLGDAA